jgi:hypothetical protein
MHVGDPDQQDIGHRLKALAERLRLQPEEPSNAEVEREAAALRELPRSFRPPVQRS